MLHMQVYSEKLVTPRINILVSSIKWDTFDDVTIVKEDDNDCKSLLGGVKKPYQVWLHYSNGF